MNEVTQAANTYKVYLTEAQWCDILCATEDDAIAAAVEKCQPEMYARLCATQETPAKAESSGTSPVASENATEACDEIGRMRSKERLQSIIDNDTRVTVKEAAAKRLADLD